MMNRLKELMLSPGLSYAIYTQTTDVENERNGIFTYDRAVFKGDMERFRKANEEVIATGSLALEPLTDSFHFDARELSATLVLTTKNFNNFSCETELSLSAGGEAGVLFRAADGEQAPAYYAGLAADGGLTLSYRDTGGWTALKTAPLTVRANEKYRLRVAAFGGTIRVYVDDMKAAKIETEDFRRLSGTAGLRVVSGSARFGKFDVTNPFVRLRPADKNAFLSHDSRQKDLVRIDNNVNRSDDALWELVARAGGVAFQSARTPGFWLRNKDGRVVYERDDGTPEFARETAWAVREGLVGRAMNSYESLSRPGEYLRHKGGVIVSATCATEQEKSDATFQTIK